MTLRETLLDRFKPPFQTGPGSLTATVHDSDGNLLCVIDPTLPRDLQLAAADLVRDMLNGPMLDPHKFYREAYSGRAMVGSVYNAEFAQVTSREFVEIDPGEELDKP